MKAAMQFALVLIFATQFACAGKPQFFSNIHTGNVPQWVIPASLSPAFDFKNKLMAVGTCQRMLDGGNQKRLAANAAIFKILDKVGFATVIISGLYTDDDGGIYAVAETKEKSGEPEWVKNAPGIFEAGYFIYSSSMSGLNDAGLAQKEAQENARIRMERFLKSDARFRIAASEKLIINAYYYKEERSKTTYCLLRVRIPGI